MAQQSAPAKKRMIAALALILVFLNVSSTVLSSLSLFEQTLDPGKKADKTVSPQTDAPFDTGDFSYLPERTYITDGEKDTRPETLSDLLLSDQPDIDAFLFNRDLADTLLQAEQIGDIVRSRKALSGLRSIQAQLETRLTEPEPPLAALVAEPESAPPESAPDTQLSQLMKPDADVAEFMPAPARAPEREAVADSAEAKALDEAASHIGTVLPGSDEGTRLAYTAQRELLERLAVKTAELLETETFGEWMQLPPSINLKGVWEETGTARIHFTPEGDWLPEDGYTIYRVIDGEREIIRTRAAAKDAVSANDGTRLASDAVLALYQESVFTAAKSAAIELDEASFNAQFYKVRESDSRARIGGEQDFLDMQTAQITIPAGIGDKMPAIDQNGMTPVTAIGSLSAGQFQPGAVKLSLQERYTVNQASVPNGLDEFEMTASDARVSAARSILAARQQLATLSFVDAEAAETLGFLIEDDLTALELSDGMTVTYQIEAAGDRRAAVELTVGDALVLSAPQGFMGYGLDGQVSLRWRPQEAEAERKILAGYFIERKLAGEEAFTTINDAPVVIGYIRDETGLLFEATVMHIDPLPNGTEAEYRLVALDIFGRKSPYSDTIASIHQMEVDIKDYIRNLTAVTAERERLESELNIARQIQASMLPRTFPPFPQINAFDLYASMVPAKEVGGDFYDYFLLGDHQLCFLIADVSGKGIPAALFMVVAKTLLKNQATAGLPPHEILSGVNDMLADNNDANMFVTAWIGILDINSGVLRYANAGHNHPLLCRKNGTYTFLKGKTGFVLGGMPGMAYQSNASTLGAGDTLFLYTDGVTEATDSQPALYGDDRLIRVLDAAAEASPAHLIESVASDIDAFVGTAPQFDDITMLAIHVRGREETHEMAWPAESGAMPDVLSFIEEQAERAGYPRKLISQLQMVTDEIVSNVIRYSGAEHVTVTLDSGSDQVQLTVSDNGTPYDPLARPDPDITLTAEERQIGGLGTYITKTIMDDVSYRYADGKNILRMTKRIPT